MSPLGRRTYRCAMTSRPAFPEGGGTSRRPESMASLTLGSGPPLLFLPGLTPDHQQPRGAARVVQLRQLGTLSATRQVWWVGRRQGLEPGTTMAGIARDYATVLREWQEAPIDVVGVSTGGSVALQLAADHPELVRRVVLLASACRLGPAGRSAQRRAIEALERGDRRRAAAALLQPVAAGRLAPTVLGAMGWLLPGQTVARDHADLLATLRAEDGFDLTDRLGSIEMPALVVGGDRDAVYGEALFRETASGLARGHLVLYPGRSHMGTVSAPRLGQDVTAFLTGD